MGFTAWSYRPASAANLKATSGKTKDFILTSSSLNRKVGDEDFVLIFTFASIDGSSVK